MSRSPLRETLTTKAQRHEIRREVLIYFFSLSYSCLRAFVVKVILVSALPWFLTQSLPLVGFRTFCARSWPRVAYAVVLLQDTVTPVTKHDERALR